VADSLDDAKAALRAAWDAYRMGRPFAALIGHLSKTDTYLIDMPGRG
jgi:hypothetical protein